MHKEPEDSRLEFPLRISLKENPDFFSRCLFWAGLFFYVLFYALHYPPIFAFRDESIYMSLAAMLRQGIFRPELADVPNNYFMEILGHWVPIYSLGNSAALLPFTLIHWRACFLLGFFCHLLGTWTFMKMLRFSGLFNPFYALLYLYFPGFVLFSRTVMSDIPSMTFFLFGTYFYFTSRKNLWLSGFFWGFSLTFRITNVVALGPFFVKLFFDAAISKKTRPFLTALTGVLFFLALIAFQNNYYYGSPFLFGLSSKFNGLTNFSSRYFIENAGHYFTSLTLIYPLLSLTFLDWKMMRIVPEWWVSSFLLSLLYLFYYFHDQFPGKFVTWSFGNRYLFPILPCLLLAYARRMQLFTRAMPPLWRKIFLFFIFSGLVVSNFFIQKRHQSALEGQVVLKNLIYQNTGEDDILIHDFNSAELLQKAWGNREYYLPRDQDLQPFLSRRDDSKRIFVVTRDISTAQMSASSELKESLAGLRGEWTVIPVAGQSGVKIFRLSRFRGSSSLPLLEDDSRRL